MTDPIQYNRTDVALRQNYCLKIDLGILAEFQNIFIAYSGGVDSHVLLHLCASDQQLKHKITAVYINHGLQKEAGAWAKHCESVCAQLKVRFLSKSVDATPTIGQSPEEAARNARYAALKPLLEPNDALLLAQHREDQLETVLLQLFRGSGLKGLSGMAVKSVFGEGALVRPLLNAAKADILRYAEAHSLDWIEDPSNSWDDYDRNFLRKSVIPKLKTRWPALDKTVARSAQLCAEADEMISYCAAKLFENVLNPADLSLNIERLKDYSHQEQQIIVRQWFQCLHLRMPSRDFVDKVLHQVMDARPEANPVLAQADYSIRRYRQSLFCVKLPRLIIEDGHVWSSNEEILAVSDGIGYRTIPSLSGISAERWRSATVTVRFRSGGETLRLPGRAGRHELKKLYQEAGIPTWCRDAIPLFYLDGKLAAVGEYWIDTDFYSESCQPCLRIELCKINPKGHDGSADVD